MYIYAQNALWLLIKNMLVIKTALPNPHSLSQPLPVVSHALPGFITASLLGLALTAHDLTKLMDSHPYFV